MSIVRSPEDISEDKNSFRDNKEVSLVLYKSWLSEVVLVEDKCWLKEWY